MSKELIEVANILNEIGANPSRNSKESILKQHKNNKTLQKVLEYAYNPYKVYGVGKKSLEDVGQVDSKIDVKYNNIFDLLDFLASNNLNNGIKSDMISFINSEPVELQELYVKMILKDLRLGATAKTINKIFKGLIPEFNLMLAKKYEDRAEKILSKEIVISIKLDGIRLAIVKNGNDIKFMTRQGKVMEGLSDIEEDIKNLPSGVYDGELLKINPNGLDSKDLFAETRKETGKKGLKKDLMFHVFDYIPIDEFNNGKSKLNCLDRKEFISNEIGRTKFNWVKEVEILEVTKDHNRIKYWLDEAVKNNAEGIMVNLSCGRYECKRSNQILKVKQFHTVDLKVVGFEEGEGRLENTLGRVNVEYKDGVIIGVGSGFTDVERLDVWSNQDKYLDKIIEVNYFEESANDKDDKLNLRFPTFSRWRLDKDEVSFN